LFQDIRQPGKLQIHLLLYYSNCPELSQNPTDFSMCRIRHMHLHRFMPMYASIQRIKPLQIRMALNSYILQDIHLCPLTDMCS